jgi:hypothetical protein
MRASNLPITPLPPGRGDMRVDTSLSRSDVASIIRLTVYLALYIGL